MDWPVEIDYYLIIFLISTMGAALQGSVGFGLGFVLVISTVIGFGIGGIVIAATVGISEGLGYLTFIVLTVMLGMVYLSLSMCISAYCKKRVTSIVGGIMIFFWAMIYGMIIMGLMLASGISIGEFLEPGFTDFAVQQSQ